MTAKGGEAHITLAGRSESYARCTYHVGAIEQVLKELPRTAAIRRTHPDIRSILATIALEAEGTQGCEHPLGIVHVVVNGGADLLLAFRGVDGLGSTLADVTGAVELGTLTTIPQWIERYALASECGSGEVLGHNGVATTDACEACRLGV